MSTLRSTSRGRNFRGFTLLEILVALLIVAVLSLSLFASMKIAFAARKSAVDAIAPVSAAQAAMDIVAMDIEATLPPTGILAGPMYGTDATGDGGAASDDLTIYTASGYVRPDYSTDQSQGDMSRIGILDSSSKNAKKVASDVQNVEYAISADAETGQSTLVRRVTRNLLTTVTSEADEQVLCRGAVSLNFRYYDGSDWLDEWDSSQNDNQLPLAVEVTLEIDRSAAGNAVAGAPAPVGNHYTVKRTVMMPAAIGAGDQGTQVKR